MVSIVEVYRQHRIEYEIRGDEWINTRCPHCGGTRLKLGFHLPSGPFFCWQCNSHSVPLTLAALLGVSEGEARAVARGLPGARGGDRASRRDREATRAVHAALERPRYRRPPGVGPLRARHRSYLEGRGFDPDRLAAEWGVASTGPASYLDDVDYSHRILVPVVWGGAEVSFQARAVGSGAGRAKYLSCQPSREAVPHKSILYGRQSAWSGRTGIVVEGVADAWRLGPLAFAVFGVAFSRDQVREIARHFDRVVVIFDGERVAQSRAHRLRDALAVSLDRVRLVSPGEGIDPGSMTDADARALAREVERWGRLVSVS